MYKAILSKGYRWYLALALCERIRLGFRQISWKQQLDFKIHTLEYRALTHILKTIKIKTRLKLSLVFRQHAASIYGFVRQFRVSNKTWSSGSNSSLSKTFALASFEILKYRSSVFSLKRSFSLKLILG